MSQSGDNCYIYIYIYYFNISPECPPIIPSLLEFSLFFSKFLEDKKVRPGGTEKLLAAPGFGPRWAHLTGVATLRLPRFSALASRREIFCPEFPGRAQAAHQRHKCGTCRCCRGLLPENSCKIWELYRYGGVLLRHRPGAGTCRRGLELFWAAPGRARGAGERQVLGP